MLPEPHPTVLLLGAYCCLGPGLLSQDRLVITAGVSCWFGKPSPVQRFTVRSQKYNGPVCQEHWILAGILMAYFKLKGVERCLSG